MKSFKSVWCMLFHEKHWKHVDFAPTGHERLKCSRCGERWIRL